MTSDRLSQQLRFLIEIDRAKQILRQTLLMDGSRQENDAEHSWHMAVMAVLLAEYAAEPGLPGVIAFYGGEVDEKTVFCFNYSPKFEVVPLLRADLKRMFRRLPRFFRVHSGRIVGIWEDAPPDARELR